MQETLGRVLREWRHIRRFSQLDLSGLAGVSARHISFLETGRARPTRGMVLRLSEVLNMPVNARNQLLIAAGMAPALSNRNLGAKEKEPLHQAMEWMLLNHEPYPAMALDRHWRLVALNQVAQFLLAPAGLGQGDSLLTAFLHNTVLRDAIENIEELEQFMRARLRTELVHLGRDEVLETAIAELESRQNAQSLPRHTSAEIGVVLTTRFRVGDSVLCLFSTISQFGGANDELYSELKIELMFPADEESGAMLRALPLSNL
ncbi:helix-turn-helix transcriptional regulator [Cognatishimia sp. WU-CL00825]|uniref:helix-turn-helix domain-containing protein n=1 Tax=Cognatishimia sp. WU-CL00825 TaxID=3127658 RepID=UPI003109FE69